MNSPNFPRPELLLHPNIPKPLHGVNPRTILGRKWWDEQRKIAYARYDDLCWACGIHKTEAKYHQWLEAHEVYKIDYSTGKVEMVEICALCHSCHQYIHDGRMQKLFNHGQFSFQKYIDILSRGEKIIKRYLTEVAINYKGEAWKKPLEETLPFQETFPDIIVPNVPEVVNSSPQWHEWYLLLEGQEYYSRFVDVKEWADYYQWLHRNNLPDNGNNLLKFKGGK
ncbi:MAG: hypothetical protein N5P05_004108 (plasmid) [Chroococcopsis gigantea SAG 12.99]|jgi:hypothetical protein|nr:hypothetical protein [Chroococcopsis gigantea SAG 12.99]